MDCSTILLMSEEDLKNLIPKYGDRVAIRNFAMKKNTSKKQSLIEKLRENINQKNGTGDSSRAIQKKKNTVKQTRFIEIGWYNMDKSVQRHRQVRKAHGGGSRRVSMDKCSKSKEILDVGKKLFFPNGISTKGPLAAFEIELLDYKCHKFDSNITIQEMYELSALTTLRFYVATTRKSDDSDDDESYYIPATVIRSNSNQENDSEIETPTIRRSQRLRSSGVLQEYVANYTADEYVPDTQFSIESEGVVGSGDYDLFNLNENNIYELPSLQNYSQPNQNIENLVVHRGNVFKELVEAVKARNIHLQNVHIEMILPNGSSEQAEDMGGVLRDTISEFFTTFYEICTMGADFKVPCLRHDLQKEEWQAIAKIISQSYESEGYFPIKIAPVFIKECFGQSVGDDEVLNNFFKYVSSSESCLLKNALERFEEVEFEEIIELCEFYEAKVLPNKNNFKEMLQQIAKEELIQKPSFVKECFSPYLKLLDGKLDLDEMYSKLQPTDKNIISLLEIDDNLSTEKKQIITYLKKYIKECDAKTREAFLRFCTGSDLANQCIKIEFIGTQGYARVPIAHTCSKLLQIPISYENSMTFRSEFNNVLSSNIWIMDII